jgi:hypothetical protein
MEKININQLKRNEKFTFTSESMTSGKQWAYLWTNGKYSYYTDLDIRTSKKYRCDNKRFVIKERKMLHY